MSAPEIAHHVKSVHPGSDLAVADDSGRWSRVHRVSSVTRLSVRESSYVVACGLHVETENVASPLSSGRLSKIACCRSCWSHLITGVVPVVSTVEAIRRASVDELMSMLGRLDVVPGKVAECYRKDCWSTLADLGLGCNCTESAHTLVLSAEHWLSAA